MRSKFRTRDSKLEIAPQLTETQIQQRSKTRLQIAPQNVSVLEEEDKHIYNGICSLRDQTDHVTRIHGNYIRADYFQTREMSEKRISYHQTRNFLHHKSRALCLAGLYVLLPVMRKNFWLGTQTGWSGEIVSFVSKLFSGNPRGPI
jgi:hypothetical protein